MHDIGAAALVQPGRKAASMGSPLDKMFLLKLLQQTRQSSHRMWHATHWHSAVQERRRTCTRSSRDQATQYSSTNAPVSSRLARVNCRSSDTFGSQTWLCQNTSKSRCRRLPATAPGDGSHTGREVHCEPNTEAVCPSYRVARARSCFP